jgi:glutamyl-tRNA(Gln) amidotransferase subunit E
MHNDLSFQIRDDAFYHELGMRSGLEIHQQLRTRHKLFCKCPAGEYSQTYDATILRHMRPTLSEMGEYDPTALMEFKTRKEIVYQITRDTTCTYEMDDAPPFMLNEEALDIALEITLLLGCSVVGELHIARKQYLDGSIPAGFQRTTILGVDGEIQVAGRPIGIVQLGLEEDSCRQIRDCGHTRTFRTDRLSIPLIESVTRPELRTPHEVAQACEQLRRLHRMTGKVRTGIGAGRQDVNVSIEGGTRVEIKGVHRIPRIPGLVHVEALRQRQLLRLKDAIHEAGLRLEDWTCRVVDLTDAIHPGSPETAAAALSDEGRLSAVVLPGFAGLLNHPTQPGGVVFAQEVADRLRVVACLDVLPNMLHSDDPEWGGLTDAERSIVRERTELTDTDAVVLLWGRAPDVETGVREIELRVREAFEGVPRETRQALSGGQTAFERVLPGPDRMYPDTDLPLSSVEDERIERIRAILPELPWTLEARLEEQGLPEDVVRGLVFSPRAASIHDRLVAAGREPMLSGTVLVRTMTRLRREGMDVGAIAAEAIEGLFEAVAEGRIYREAMTGLLRRMAAGEPDPVAAFPEPLAETERDALIAAVADEAAGRTFDGPDEQWRWTMGRITHEAHGRIDAAAVARLAKQGD